MDKKPHGTKVGFNSDHKCADGEEQCAYCSATCDNGCRVVPEGTLSRENFISVHASNAHPSALVLIDVQGKDARIVLIAKPVTIANGRHCTPHYFARAPAQVSSAGFICWL